LILNMHLLAAYSSTFLTTKRTSRAESLLDHKTHLTGVVADGLAVLPGRIAPTRESLAYQSCLATLFLRVVMAHQAA
jgi:hypothetical protein